MRWRPGALILLAGRLAIPLELYEAVYTDVHPELLSPLTIVIESQAAVRDHAAVRRSVERYLLVMSHMGDDALPVDAEWAWRYAALAHEAEGHFEAAAEAYERALDHSRRFRTPDDPALHELSLGAERAREP